MLQLPVHATGVGEWKCGSGVKGRMEGGIHIFTNPLCSGYGVFSVG